MVIAKIDAILSNVRYSDQKKEKKITAVVLDAVGLLVMALIGTGQGIIKIGKGQCQTRIDCTLIKQVL